MEIIPAIDIIDGNCVRLTQGDFSKKIVYSQDPLEIARRFEKAGLKRLHLVDLDGAKAKRVVNLKVLRDIASNTQLAIDFGGGVRTTGDLDRVLRAGASQVTGGSIAVKDPGLFQSWLKAYGPERLILGADVLDEKIAVSGWQERTPWSLWDFLDEYVEKGIRYVVCTDVNKDGMLQGPALSLYQKLVLRYPQLFVIASGGISRFQDLTALNDLGVHGAIIGKALYEGKITLDQLQEFIHAH